MEQLMDKAVTKREGAISMLRDRISQLHDEIDRLANQLGPVLGQEALSEPASILETIANSEIEEVSLSVERAVARLDGLHQRLVI